MTLDMLMLLDDAEHGATVEQLEAAPQIDNWWLESVAEWLRARGELTGHLEISDPFVITSPVLGFDVEARWMRTRSRFYGIGRPLALAEGMRLYDAVPFEEAQRMLAAVRADLRAACESMHGDDHDV